MKQILIALFLLGSLSSFGQLYGDWFGLFSKGNGQGRVDVHINAANSRPIITIDLPTDDKTGIMVDDTKLDDKSFFLTINKNQLAIDVKKDPLKDELAGEIVLSGRPYPILFTKVIPGTATSLQPLLRGTGESGDKSLSPDINSARPIPVFNSVFVEELTWMDVRDALQQGKNSIIIATGGTEQSGPYVAMGKHNFILKLVTDSIARRLGNALVAPIVPYVPEGDFDPPTMHLKYPGSISLKEETYELLLKDIASSYKVEGFKHVIFFGDSGGNQWGMYKVAKELNDAWEKDGVDVVFIPEYYDNNRISKWLKEKGIEEVSEGIHDAYKVEAQIAVLDPRLIRAAERITANKFSINGIDLLPLQKTVESGKSIISYQTGVTVAAINKRLQNKSTVKIQSTVLKIGDKAPGFAAKDQDGKTVSLKDYKGKKIALYFYPKDFTQGCTAEACNLRDNYDTLTKAGYVIIGVSTDDDASHKNFKDKYTLPFTLLADTDTLINRSYGVWVEKERDGKKIFGTARTTFVINGKGIITGIIDKVDTKQHAVQLLQL